MDVTIHQWILRYAAFLTFTVTTYILFLQVEDVEFESAFEKMVVDNMADRQRENRPQQRDIAVPMTCRQQTKKTYEQLLVNIKLIIIP